MDTYELTVELSPSEPWSEIVIACLAENGFDGFVESKTGVQAYSQSKFDEDEIIALLHSIVDENVKMSIASNKIPQQNWNATWEENFDPVLVENYCTIVAPFHDVAPKGMKVVIQPQMSFGTGHHQTTWLMTKMLFEAKPFKRVLDMGTGTGVLAIVAEKLGANYIMAVDIEPWSLENTIENAARNNCKRIKCICGDIDVLGSEQYDLILANINKNVLKSHLKSYFNMLESKGVLMMSGFFDTDVSELVELADQIGLKFEHKEVKEGWAAIVLHKR